MIESFSNHIVNRLIESNLILKDEAVICSYGLRQLLQYIRFFCICLFIGVVSHNILGVICFLICFIPLRNVTGGFHMRNETSCLFFSVLTIIFYILTNYLVHTMNIHQMIIPIIILCVLQLVTPVVDHPNKPADDLAKKVFGSVKQKAVIAESIVGILAGLGNLRTICYAVLIAMSFNLCSNLLGLVFRNLHRNK